MNKGIVMEINESNIIVMTSNGRFDKLPSGTRACQVGEEILYADVAAPRRKVPPLAAVSGLVAAVLLCFVLITGLRGTTANGEVVAYVSIDINPSVEMGIDNQEIVRDLRGINTDGVDLIASLNYQGKNLEEVTSAILDKAEQGALAKGEGDIVISSTVVQGKTSLNDEALADKLKQQVAKHIKDAHPTQVKNYEVTAFAAPEEIREEAKVSGVSAGKYAVYLTAVNNGVNVSLDDIQNLSIHQIAKDNGGISKLVDPAKPITKAELKELLKDEKSGKLAEKFQEKENSNSGKTNNTNTKNGKDSSNDKNNNNSGNNDKNSSTNTNKSNSSNNGKNNGNNDKSNSKNNDNNGKSNSKNNQNDKNSESTDKNSSSNDFINRGDDNKKDSTKNDNNREEGSSSTDKPVISDKPTSTPKQTPSPTPKSKVGSDSGSGSDSSSKKDKKDKNDKNDKNDKTDKTDKKNKNSEEEQDVKQKGDSVKNKDNPDK